MLIRLLVLSGEVVFFYVGWSLLDAVHNGLHNAVVHFMGR